MTILLDENLPRGLRRVLAPRAVITVQQAGFAGLENGQLLAAVEGHFEIFLTADKNIRYQQNLTGRQLAIVELPTNRWPLLRPMQDRIVEAVDQSTPGSYLVVEAAR